MTSLSGAVVAVALSASHSFTKAVVPNITLVVGVGVHGDAHAGATVQHRSRVAHDPTQPNLRQVHLMHQELHDELRDSGFSVAPGSLGENITTRGLDLLGLPVGAVLTIGVDVILAITGLRNPCHQLNDCQPGLLSVVAHRHADGHLVRKAGVMAVVLAGGSVTAGDGIEVTLPSGPHRPLDRV